MHLEHRHTVDTLRLLLDYSPQTQLGRQHAAQLLPGMQGCGLIALHAPPGTPFSAEIKDFFTNLVSSRNTCHCIQQTVLQTQCSTLSSRVLELLRERLCCPAVQTAMTVGGWT